MDQLKDQRTFGQWFNVTMYIFSSTVLSLQVICEHDIFILLEYDFSVLFTTLLAGMTWNQNILNLTLNIKLIFTIQNFDHDWDISTTIGWIDIKCGTEMFGF